MMVTMTPTDKTANISAAPIALAESGLSYATFARATARQMAVQPSA